MFFTLLDLTSRSGLKKIHANFEGICRRIDGVYQANLNNEKIRGGIISLYARMCVDSILRNRLFDKGKCASVPKALLASPPSIEISFSILSRSLGKIDAAS